MKGDSTGGMRQDGGHPPTLDSARERGPSLDTLHSLVGLSGFRCIVADLFLLTVHGQCATMAEMKGYRHE